MTEPTLDRAVYSELQETAGADFVDLEPTLEPLDDILNNKTEVYNRGPQSGGTKANVERWFSQFEEGRDKINAKSEEKKFPKGIVTYVSAEGTYKSGMPGTPPVPKPGFALLGGIVEDNVAAGRDMGRPEFEVLLHRFVAMIAVDEQQADGAAVPGARGGGRRTSSISRRTGHDGAAGDAGRRRHRPGAHERPQRRRRRGARP